MTPELPHVSPPDRHPPTPQRTKPQSTKRRRRRRPAPRPSPAPRPLHEWVDHRPGLSQRARRLLLDGDIIGRYQGGTSGENGYRMTMALAVACSQPGREWTPDQFFEALLLRETAGGSWARALRRRKGEEHARDKLGEMLDKARRLVGSTGHITCRTDAVLEIQRVRDAVEREPWRSSSGGMDEKNLTARLRLAERSGGLDHQVSVRQLAELMGCARSTAENSNKRLSEAGWLVLLSSGAGKGSASDWQIRIPHAASADDHGAAPGQSPAAGGRGAVNVPATHTPQRNTRALQAVMADDAFHHYAHGSSGARLLACLDPLDGSDVATLAAATGLHRTTVKRRLNKLLEDGLAEEADDLYYLARSLAAPQPGAALLTDEDQLADIARERGTDGLGERRRLRHHVERENYRRVLDERQQRVTQNRRPGRPPLRLVPQGVVDPTTGEILDPAWHGWDTSDPIRPVWLGSGARSLPATTPETISA